MKVQSIIRVSFFTNTFLSILKIVSGIIIKSSALLADGIHSFSDLVTDVVASVGNIAASKPKDKEHPYGHGNAEYLTSYTIGILIIIMAIILIKETISQELTVPGLWVAIISFFTIFVKFCLSSFLIKKGKTYKNNILTASGKESRTDMISSTVVLISSILVCYKDYVPIFIYSDKIAGVIVGIFIIITGIKIMKENTKMILGKQEDAEFLKEKLLSYPCILKVDNIVLIKCGPTFRANVEVTMKYKLLKKAHDRAHEIEEEIKKDLNNIEYITIHINPKNS